jgi:hypothetical protein
MKLIGCVVIGLTLCAAAADASGVRVRGYVTRCGTYVVPSMRTSPNRTRTDNWSSRPNVNPYTGRAGTKDPYATRSYRSRRH